MGIVYAPALRQMFFGCQNYGAWKTVNGKKTNYEIYTLLKLCLALDVTPNEIIEKDNFIESQLKK